MPEETRSVREEVKTTRPSIGEVEELDSSQKIVRAVIGGIVVILLVLLVLGIVNFLRSRLQASRQTPAPAPLTRPIASPSANLTQSKQDDQTATTSANYQSMPETGPEKLGMMFLVVSLILGASTVAISKKFA